MEQKSAHGNQGRDAQIVNEIINTPGGGEANDYVIQLQTNFYFLLPISRESIVLGSNFQNEDFDGFTRFEVP